VPEERDQNQETDQENYHKMLTSGGVAATSNFTSSVKSCRTAFGESLTWVAGSPTRQMSAVSRSRFAINAPLGGGHGAGVRTGVQNERAIFAFVRVQPFHARQAGSGLDTAVDGFVDSSVPNASKMRSFRGFSFILASSARGSYSLHLFCTQSKDSCLSHYRHTEPTL
jgi:hypothetical protein